MGTKSDLHTRGLRWDLMPALQKTGIAPDFLFGPDGLRIKDWLARGQAGALKQGPHRSVYRVALPHLDFILKWFPGRGKGKRLRGLTQASEARRECDLALEVAARGVATVEPLAVGESRGGTSCLLLRTLADVEPLGAFLEWSLPEMDQALARKLRFQLAKSLGVFLARMHDAGVIHTDLHPGNILLRLADQPQLFLIDLQSVRLGPALDWRASRDNLVLINRWFALRATHADRLRFWQVYRLARTCPTWLAEMQTGTTRIGATLPGMSDEISHHAIRELEKNTMRSNLRFWKAQDGRCLETGRYYRQVSSSVAAGHSVADLDPQTVADFLEDPDAAFSRPDAIVLKDAGGSTVIECDVIANGRKRRVIYKRFAVDSWTDPLVALLRRTPAVQSYVMGHGLRLRGLPTPRPLGVWHRYRAGLPNEGYLLTEKLPDAVDLWTFIDKLRGLPDVEAHRTLRRAIDRLARLVAQMHQRQLSNRDLKLANILLSPEPWSLARSEQERRYGAGSAPNEAKTTPGLADLHPWFIDLVGVRAPRRLPHGRRVQNLARLNASFHLHAGITLTDRLRFLRVYLGFGLQGKMGWKTWWRQIAAATQAKVSRNLRKGRPLR